jgi:hypothetical protein
MKGIVTERFTYKDTSANVNKLPLHKSGDDIDRAIDWVMEVLLRVEEVKNRKYKELK